MAKTTPTASTAKSREPSRTQRPFPAVSFEDAGVLATEIQRLAGGQPRIRRLTLFEQLGRSPDSGLARQQIVNSNRYGLTKGSYKAEFLELTPKGAAATDPDHPARERTRARFELAIADVAPLAALYETLKGNKLPAQPLMRDQLVADPGLSAEFATEAVELFIVNAKHVGILRPVSGTERVLTIEHVLDEQPASGQAPPGGTDSGTPSGGASRRAHPTAAAGDFEHTCFYVTPIGDEDSEPRKHADVWLGHLVEPAVEALDIGLRVVRADHIDNPGLITAQVIQHLLHARLVIADLSFHNPNVFYELAIRHATGKPTVLLCRTEDTLPVRHLRRAHHPHRHERHPLLCHPDGDVAGRADQHGSAGARRPRRERQPAHRVRRRVPSPRDPVGDGLRRVAAGPDGPAQEPTVTTPDVQDWRRALPLEPRGC